MCVLNKNVRLVYMYIHGNSHVTWGTYVCMYIANVHSVGGEGLVRYTLHRIHVQKW